MQLARPFRNLLPGLQLQPEQAEMRYAWGRALLEVGKRAEAAEQFQETLRLNPNHAEANELLDHLRRTGEVR